MISPASTLGVAAGYAWAARRAGAGRTPGSASEPASTYGSGAAGLPSPATRTSDRIWFNARVRAFEPLTLATRRTLTNSPFPSLVLARAVALPECPARAATTASSESDLPVQRVPAGWGGQPRPPPRAAGAKRPANPNGVDHRPAPSSLFRPQVDRRRPLPWCVTDDGRRRDWAVAACPGSPWAVASPSVSRTTGGARCPRPSRRVRSV